MNVVLRPADGSLYRQRPDCSPLTRIRLQAKLKELMPGRNRPSEFRGAENAIVLTGSVSDGVTLDQVVTSPRRTPDGKKVINMMRVTSPQQVMLEV